MSNATSRSGPSRLVIATLLSGVMLVASPSWGADDLNDLVDTSAAKAQPDKAPVIALPPTSQQADQGAESGAQPSSLFGSIRQTPQPPQPQSAPVTAPAAPVAVAAPTQAPPPPPSRPMREKASDFIDTSPPPPSPKPALLAPPSQQAAPTPAAEAPPPKAPTLVVQEAKPATVKADGVLFAEAQTSSRRVGRVLAGQAVVVLAQGDGWAQIQTAGGVTGYVSANAVTQATATATPTSLESKPQEGTSQKIQPATEAKSPAAQPVEAGVASPQPGSAQDAKPAPSVEAKPATIMPATIKADGVLFAEAQTSSRRVGRVMAGQTVSLLLQGNGWAQVRTAGGVTGYVSADAVAQAVASDGRPVADAKPATAAVAPQQESKAPETTAPAAKASQTAQPQQAQESVTQERDVVSIASANVYATPDAKGKRVAKLTEGQTIALIELLDDGWAKIKTKSGVVGYVKDDGIVDPDVYESRKAASSKSADAETQRQREERQRTDQEKREKSAQAEADARSQSARSTGGGSTGGGSAGGGSSQAANPELTALAERFLSGCSKTGLPQAKCRNLANTIRQGADPIRGLQTVGGALPGDRIIRGPFAGALIVRDEGNGAGVYATQASPRNEIQVSRFDGSNGQAPIFQSQGFQSQGDGLDLGGILQGVISGAVSGAVSRR